MAHPDLGEQEKTLLQITHEGDRPHWPGCQFPGDVPGYCNCDLTEQMLARIAADRGLLAEALKYQPGQPGYGMARQAMKFLASTHADRPGYQEAWKPEA